MPTHPSQFPLIQDILQNYPPQQPDTHPTSWLSSPTILAAVKNNMPIGYPAEALLGPTGQLLVWGSPKAEWSRCLKIDGVNWDTVRSDLKGLFETHESIEPPVVVGTGEEFVALVFMKSLEACEDAIGDLNGAVIGCDSPLRVGFATGEDLERVLELQKKSLKGGCLSGEEEGGIKTCMARKEVLF